MIEPILSERVYRIVSPMPAPLEPVNLYVFRCDDGLALIDTGIRSKRSRRAIEDALATIGATLADVRHVVLTHAHVDHAGLAAQVPEASGAVVWAHDETARALATPFRAVEPERHPAFAFFRRIGLPAELATRVLSIDGYMLERMREPAAVARRLAPGEPLELAPWRFDVVATPGHCPGHVSLVEARARLIVCGDHLHAERLPPCPLPLEPARAFDLDVLVAASPQDDLVRSLARTAPFAAFLHLPGHGPLFEGAAPVYALYARKLEERLGRIHDACREPRDVHAIASALYGAAAETIAWLVASETLHGVVSLLRQGAVRAREQGGVVAFEASGPWSLPREWRELAPRATADTMDAEPRDVRRSR